MLAKLRLVFLLFLSIPAIHLFARTDTLDITLARATDHTLWQFPDSNSFFPGSNVCCKKVYISFHAPGKLQIASLLFWIGTWQPAGSYDSIPVKIYQGDLSGMPEGLPAGQGWLRIHDTVRTSYGIALHRLHMDTVYPLYNRFVIELDFTNIDDTVGMVTASLSPSGASRVQAFIETGNLKLPFEELLPYYQAVPVAVPVITHVADTGIDIGLVKGKTFITPHTAIPLDHWTGAIPAAAVYNHKSATAYGIQARVMVTDIMGNPVFSTFSDVLDSLPAGTLGTLQFPAAFLPPDTGLYLSTFVIHAAVTDINPENDTMKRAFYVNRTWFAYDHSILTGNVDGYFQNSGTEDLIIGNVFRVSVADTVTAIRIAVKNLMPGDTVTGGIFRMNGQVPGQFLVQTLPKIITPQDTGLQYLRLKFINNGRWLSPGQYLFCVMIQKHRQNVKVGFTESLDFPARCFYKRGSQPFRDFSGSPLQGKVAAIHPEFLQVKNACKTLSIQLPARHPACNANANGKITAVVTGGVPPYQYLWSDGSQATTIHHLPAGIYGLTVTDDIGCFKDTVMVLQSLDTFEAKLDSMVPPRCSGDSNGKAFLFVKNNAPGLQFLWDNGEQTNPAIHLTGGQRTAIVVDTSGCSDTVTFIMPEPPPFQPSLITRAVSCHGANDGRIILQGSGGTPPYRFSWSNGATTNAIYQLSSGIYTVTVTDNQNCTIVLTDTLTDPPAIETTFAIQAANCPFNDGTIHIDTLWGGTPPYRYQWSTGDTTPDLINIAAGVYSLTITDSKACQVVYTDTVWQSNGPVTTVFSKPPSCHGSADGEVIIVVSNGVPPYYYSQDGVSYQLPDTLKNLPAGNYQFIIRDSLQCMASTGWISLIEPMPVKIDSVWIRASTGDDGEIMIWVSGGTPPYQIFWSNGVTSAFNQQLPPGPLHVYIVDANGCRKQKTFLIPPATGIFVPHEQPEINIFPIPARDFLYVSLSGNARSTQGWITIKMSNITGGIVHQSTYKLPATPGFRIPVRHLPAGVYTLQVKNDGLNYAGRILIIH